MAKSSVYLPVENLIKYYLIVIAENKIAGFLDTNTRINY